MSGSLASNTGPRPPGSPWSVASKQMLHAGEEVRFDFILLDLFGRFADPVGYMDYCVALIGGERIESEPDSTGRCRFKHTFNRVRPGERIEVPATAYRQRGQRDFLKVRGRWLHGESPYDIADQRVAHDSIRFTVYVAPIELSLARPPDDLQPETGVLNIRRSDGTSTSIYIDRPHRPGFSITGPEPDGYYRVRYVPSGTELNPIGTTEVEFVVYDTAGHPHYASTTLDTP